MGSIEISSFQTRRADLVTPLSRQYLDLGERFMKVFTEHSAPQEHAGTVDISKKGAPQRLERLVRLSFEHGLVAGKEPIDVKLNLHADYIVPTQGANKSREHLNCLSARCWSTDWVDGAPVGDIANPRVTAGGLVKYDRAPELLEVLDRSISLAEAVVLEQTTPDVAVLL